MKIDRLSLKIALVAGLSVGTLTRAANRDAEALYQQTCSGCHGTDMGGGKGGSLLGPHKYGSDDASIARIITEGRASNGMPSFKGGLNNEEIRSLVVFIAERAANSPAPKGNKPPDANVVHHSELYSYRIEPVVQSGLQVPWSFAFLPDGRILLTERVGRVRIIDNGKLDPEPIAGIPAVVERGEGGLMAIVLAPDYTKSGWIYLSFSDPGAGETAMTKIVRGRLRGHEFTGVETIFSIPREQYQEGHVLFGGRLIFSGEYLFFSVGERGVQGDAQRLEVPNGKIHRVFADGKIPPDNPFANTSGAVGSIWSYGHRNPQGLTIDPRNGDVWETEHGPRGGDELNFAEKGKNYGWPIITYGINYDGSAITDKTAAPGLEQPVRYWTPSIATSQIAFYTGDKFPKWKNNLFLGSLAQQRFIRMEVEGGKLLHEEELFKNYGRVRDIHTGPDGFIYIALEQIGPASGLLVRLVPAEKD